ncbi:MAG TPA: DUF3617 family protein [Parasulfuritortus sp.]
MKLNVLATLLVSACLPALPANAADMPQRNSGLWQIDTRTDAGGSVSLQVCVDKKTDNLAAGNGPNRNVRPQCSKLSTQRLGDRIVVDSVCTFNGTTAISHAVVTGNMTDAYHMDSTTRFSPAVQGVGQSHAVMDGKWLDPCKPGQTPGSVTVMGMPSGGNFQLTPEMMKQMQKMQQQYGR